jgi:hypothetical protein
LVNQDEDPNCEMIDFGVHRSLRIIQASEARLQVNSSRSYLSFRAERGISDRSSSRAKQKKSEMFRFAQHDSGECRMLVIGSQ